MGLILGCWEGAGEREMESVPGHCNTNPGLFWARPEKNRPISESDLEARLRGQHTPRREACAVSGYGPEPSGWAPGCSQVGVSTGPAAPPAAATCAPSRGLGQTGGWGTGRLRRELPVDWTHTCLRRRDRRTPGATC